jgi:ubiquinol-cytochrome c reductase cytochrome b subunit
MAKIDESLFSIEGLDKRLAIKKFNKVMMTEYWIPKDINFLWAMGVVLATTFGLLVISNFLNDVLQT